MPELPEVETTRSALAPRLEGHRMRGVEVRERRFRWPVPHTLDRDLPGATVRTVRRRAKYLLVHTNRGTVLLHLGMSGSLRLVPEDTPPEPHDHVDFVLHDRTRLRLRDPRRFGCVLWLTSSPETHPLLADLGPEPLEPDFDGGLLHARARGRRGSVKPFLMDGRIVVGVGNIYASEALHRAGIHPRRPAGRISLDRYQRLAAEVRAVLSEAISRGGTTLRDFVHGDGVPGTFASALRVYGREGAPCERCSEPIRQELLGQRSTYFCPRCQR